MATSKKTVGWAAQARKASKKSGAKCHPAASGGKWLRPTTRLALYHRDGFACVCCGKGAEAGNPLTADHLHAVELGGTNEVSNLITLCLSCNSRKGSLTIRAWFALLRREGVDTSRIAGRVRRAVRRPLDRVEGRRLAALRATK